MGKGEATRGAILDVAADEAARVGLTGISIGALADATALSKSGLFAHFRSKEALQLAVLQHARAAFVDAVLRPALKAPRGVPRLRTLLERWLAWEDQGSGCVFVAAATELDDRPGPVRDVLAADQRDLLDSVAQMVRGAITEGHVPAGTDPEQVAFALHGIVLSYHHATRLLADPAAAERARRALDALLT